jgi:heme oxygenase
MHTANPSRILNDLREGTAASHRQLEDQIDIVAVCRDGGRYRRLIEGFYGFYAPIEDVLEAVRGWERYGFSWEERAKVPMLLADLGALGLTTVQIAALPRCGTLPRPVTIEEALGCAYVLEGATLGGRQIQQVLAGSDIPDGARNFFTSYGPAVGERWKEFCAMLGSLPEDGSGPVVATAQRTFDTLGTWLDGRV